MDITNTEIALNEIRRFIKTRCPDMEYILFLGSGCGGNEVDFTVESSFNDRDTLQVLRETINRIETKQAANDG